MFRRSAGSARTTWLNGPPGSSALRPPPGPAGTGGGCSNTAMNFEEASPLLEAVGMAEAGEVALDVSQLADEMRQSIDSVRAQLEHLEAWGLLLTGPEQQQPPMLLDAGRQYLRAQGAVDRDVLSFLPRTLDDLPSRQAILEAGSILVDEFAHQVAHGRAIAHAQEIVPPAFADAVTARLAVDLFSAAVALIARLMNDAPAGCVAEEIVAVRLIEEAKASLDIASDAGLLERDVAMKAAAELSSLFDLFQDDDVLRLFAMREPADAAVAENHPISRQMGVVDQRIEAWFEPFWGLPATGHLVEAAARAHSASALPGRLLHVVEPAEVVASGEASGEFRVCVRMWDDGFAERDEYDQIPPAWTYYVRAPTADEAQRQALDRFPDGATVSPVLDDDAMFDPSEIARGIDQRPARRSRPEREGNRCRLPHRRRRGGGREVPRAPRRLAALDLSGSGRGARRLFAVPRRQRQRGELRGGRSGP
jgi:hypothetical protein